MVPLNWQANILFTFSSWQRELQENFFSVTNKYLLTLVLIFFSYSKFRFICFIKVYPKICERVITKSLSSMFLPDSLMSLSVILGFLEQFNLVLSYSFVFFLWFLWFSMVCEVKQEQRGTGRFRSLYKHLSIQVCCDAYFFHSFCCILNNTE